MHPHDRENLCLPGYRFRTVKTHLFNSRAILACARVKAFDAEAQITPRPKPARARALRKQGLRIPEIAQALGVKERRGCARDDSRAHDQFRSEVAWLGALETADTMIYGYCNRTSLNSFPRSRDLNMQ